LNGVRRLMVHSLFAVENPLMDVIAHVDHAFLERFSKIAGTMHLVDYAEVVALLREISSFKTMPGGSAANTARGIAWLSSPAAGKFRRSLLGDSLGADGLIAQPVFNGAIGKDARGDEFLSLLAGAGVSAALVRKETPTGTSVILVTPEGERTMNTFLGACRDFTSKDLDTGLLAESRMLYLTGYLWDTENQRAAAESAVSFARSRGITVAFDLADPFAVKRYGGQFHAWIPGRVDILFGNQDELSLLTGGACDEDCVGSAAALAPLVAMKVGKRGCIVGHDGTFDAVPGASATVVDTTGAGDAFAAGFLFGHLAGADPRTCARLANGLAARVVGMEGCCFEEKEG
jgi:sugar/nucleoside kinase (ribokinase family)